MALLSLWDDPFDALTLTPSRILNQRFGHGLDPEEILTSYIPRRIRRQISHPYYHHRSWHSKDARDVGSAVALDKDKFQVNIDVPQFSPEEISVKATGENTITVEGKHEEKQDEHGYVSRHFVRRYVLPKGHDINKVVSKLSTDGVLTISAPKIEAIESNVREIPIQQTGLPSKALQSKKSADDNPENGACEMEVCEREKPAKRKK